MPESDGGAGEYPGWWADNIEHFEEFGLRPYRPPSFADGEAVPTVVSELEAALDATIRIRAIAPEVGDQWEVWLDSRRIGRVDRSRDADGYTVYHLEADEFREMVQDAVDGLGQ